LFFYNFLQSYYKNIIGYWHLNVVINNLSTWSKVNAEKALYLLSRKKLLKCRKDTKERYYRHWYFVVIFPVVTGGFVSKATNSAPHLSDSDPSVTCPVKESVVTVLHILHPLSDSQDVAAHAININAAPYKKCLFISR
jgi:hypothetical protein